MTEYQLKALLYDLYCNAPKLRELSKEGVISSKDMWDLQELAVKMARKDDLITD
jgi:hypothetical protein